MLWNILPPPPEAPPDRVYQHPHYSQQYRPSHQEQQQQQQQQQKQHLLHNHNNNPLPSLPPYTTYTQQRQRQPYPQHPDHTPYHTREHSHGHGYPPAPYPHNAVATPIPSAQSHCTTPAYGQKQPHLTTEERPRHSLPLSFPNDTSHHLYQQQQQQQQSMPHYRYPTTLSSAPPSAAENVSLPSWSARAPETGNMYGGTSIRPSPEATFPSHQLREADEPPFSHEYISDTSRRLSHPYAQLPEPYPFYHDHSHENPSTRTHEQNHPQRNVQFDNHFTAHAHQKPVHHHQYQHPYVPSSALRPRPPSPSRMAPSVPLYDSPKWHESTDFCPRKDDIMGNRKFAKSNDFPPLPSFAKLTNSKHTPSLPLKRKSEVEYQSSGQHEIANRYRSPPSCGRDLHRSSHTEDATRPPKPTRYPSPTTTSLNLAESLTELANASLIPKHISKSTTEESAYPSPSSSIFSDKSNGLVLQGLRRDRYTPPNHSCFSCGGSDVDAVGDGWTDGGTIPCNECGKTYQHKRNIVPQQWKETSRYPLSQKEKMQIMDAASILFTLKSVQANSTVVTSSSSSSFAASDINSRASTPGTITQPNSPQLSPDTLPTPSEEISPLSIRSLLLVSPDAGSSVTEITESETKTKTAKGRKEKKRKVSD